jgi:hypothetical protein
MGEGGNRVQEAVDDQRVCAGVINGMLLVLPFWIGVAWLIHTAM